MSQFLSRVDKKVGAVVYEIDIDREKNLPTHITVLVLNGVKGGGKSVNGEHVTFRFDYDITDVGGVEPFSVPRSAAKQLR